MIAFSDEDIETATSSENSIGRTSTEYINDSSPEMKILEGSIDGYSTTQRAFTIHRFGT